MKDPPWKRLVEELKDQGYESIYLDRLRASLDIEQQHEILETMYPIADSATS